MNCVNCGVPISYDEAGLSKKLINRNTVNLFCLACLARQFGVSEERLKEKIEEYRKAGCMLFAQKNEED